MLGLVKVVGYDRIDQVFGSKNLAMDTMYTTLLCQRAESIGKFDKFGVDSQMVFDDISKEVDRQRLVGPDGTLLIMFRRNDFKGVLDKIGSRQIIN